MTDTYSPQLVTNGNFAAGSSGWTKVVWDMDTYGYARLNPLQTGQFIQSLVIESGYDYLIEFDASVAGTPTRWGKLGGTSFNIINGSNSYTVEAGGDNDLIQFYASNTASQLVAIANISVKLVIPEGALVSNDTIGVVTVKFAVPLGHLPGDYCVLHTNNGTGAIDWDTPFSTKQVPLFPCGSGNYGFGMAPFAMSPFAMPYGKNLRRGFGTCPFAMSPFGLGAVVITERVPVSDCGDWLFGVKCYDKLGNEHTGTPNTVAATVHVAPAVPAGLKKDSYDKATDILTLSVIDPYSQTPLGNPPSQLWPDIDDGPYDGFGGSVTAPGGTTDDGAVAPGLPSKTT